MSDKQWTMNCILAGAIIAEHLLTEEEEIARAKLRDLTSELTEQDIDYLIQRLKGEI